MSTNLAFRYASVETFFKMIENQELWFTDLRNMNDPEEYSAGYVDLPLYFQTPVIT